VFFGGGCCLAVLGGGLGFFEGVWGFCVFLEVFFGGGAFWFVFRWWRGVWEVGGGRLRLAGAFRV